MSDIAVKVEGLGKKYSLKHQINRREGLSHVLENAITSLWKPRPARQTHPAGNSAPAQEDFWALKDISFAINRGDVVGIIGRNGAGKSTLLKLLSRITDPTAGTIEIEGRVASLLEVGTGFHSELTGRENIYLNGAILGMSRAEIRKKFDEIIAFAEVEKFLDTPVKHYSSGMYVRLAFAVAAHLEPEILIVDEVLAVGDSAFQKKCLGKMQDVSRNEGRTVLFVSHNLESVIQLCTRGILLHNGNLAAIGTPPEVVSQYLFQHRNSEACVALGGRRRPDWVLAAGATICQLESLSRTGAPWCYAFCDPIAFRVSLLLLKPYLNIEFGYAIFTATGFQIAAALESVAGEGATLPAGRHEVSVSIPHLRLTANQYYLNFILRSAYGCEDYIVEATHFEVTVSSTSSETKTKGIGAATIPKTDLILEASGPS